MTSLDDGKIESQVLRKVSPTDDQYLSSKESISHKVAGRDTLEEPFELKISFETKPEGSQKKIPPKYFVKLPEEKEPNIAHITSQKISTERDKERKPSIKMELDEEPKAVDHIEKSAIGDKKEKIKLIIHREDENDRFPDESSILLQAKEKIPVHEKEKEIELFSLPKDAPRELDVLIQKQKDVPKEERKTKISLQPEMFPIKYEEEESEKVPLDESMRDRGRKKKTHQEEKFGIKKPDVSGTRETEILSRTVKNIEAFEEEEMDENLHLDYLAFSEDIEIVLKKARGMASPTEDEEIPRKKPDRIFTDSVLKPQDTELKTDEIFFAKQESIKTHHEEKDSEPLLTEQVFLYEKEVGKRIIPVKKVITPSRGLLDKDEIGHFKTPETQIAEREEFETVIPGEGRDIEESLGDFEKLSRDKISDRTVTLEKSPIRMSEDDKKRFEKVQLSPQTTKDEKGETLAPKKVTKPKTEKHRSPLVIDTLTLSGREVSVVEGIPDEKSAAKHRKSLHVTKKSEKKTSTDKKLSGKGMPVKEVPVSQSLGKTITPTKRKEPAEEGRKTWSPELVHLTDQDGSIKDWDLEEFREMQEVVDGSAKSDAKQGEESCW